jgi:hypothetical protein
VVGVSWSGMPTRAYWLFLRLARVVLGRSRSVFALLQRLVQAVSAVVSADVESVRLVSRPWSPDEFRFLLGEAQDVPGV